jgi:hypothetical protein
LSNYHFGISEEAVAAKWAKITSVWAKSGDGSLGCPSGPHFTISKDRFQAILFILSLFFRQFYLFQIGLSFCGSSNPYLGVIGRNEAGPAFKGQIIHSKPLGEVCESFNASRITN